MWPRTPNLIGARSSSVTVGKVSDLCSNPDHKGHVQKLQSTVLKIPLASKPMNKTFPSTQYYICTAFQSLWCHLASPCAHISFAPVSASLPHLFSSKIFKSLYTLLKIAPKTITNFGNEPAGINGAKLPGCTLLPIRQNWPRSSQQCAKGEMLLYPQ